MQTPLNESEVEDKIADRLCLVSHPEPSGEGPLSDVFVNAATARIKASVLSNFAEFLGDYSDLLPPKDAVLAALERAIDKAFDALNRPFIASLLKPAAKRLILDAADKLYESIINPVPRTEV